MEKNNVIQNYNVTIRSFGMSLLFIIIMIVVNFISFNSFAAIWASRYRELAVGTREY